MIQIGQAEAHAKFHALPKECQIVTLSPAYVLADAHRDESLIPTFLIYERGEHFWMHSVHKGMVPNSDFIDFQSPYGYGGPLATTSNEEFLTEAWDAYRLYCQENNVLAEFVRLHPLVRHPFFGETCENRETIVLDKNSEYSATCQNKIRKAENEGLIVVRADRKSIGNFAVDYRKAMDRLKADSFYYFSDDYFKALAELPNAHLFVCELDREWLSACIILEGYETAEYHLSLTNERGRKLAATNLLLACVHTRAIEVNKCLYLGGGKTQMASDPLLEFKSSFGGTKRVFNIGTMIHRPEVYYQMLEEAQEIGSVNTRTLFWR